MRTMKNPTPEGIEEFIEKLVRGKLEDGQLSDSPLTLRDIDKICDAATQVLVGVFHERIEYPDLDDIREQMRQKAEALSGEAAQSREETVTVVNDQLGKAPRIEMAAPKHESEVLPPVMDELVAVEPLAPDKLVPITDLVAIDPLPTKEMEQELLRQEAAKIAREEQEERAKEKP